MQIKDSLQWLDPKHRKQFEKYLHPEWAYLENIRICQQWILPLRILEESLRYQCIQALLTKYGECWWDHIGGDFHVKIKAVSIDQSGNPLPWEDWIDRLSFGFWTSLFNGKYEQKFWNPLHKVIFPELPKSSRRKDVSPSLNGLRNLRNDLFHHAILLQRPIQKDLDALDNLMKWIGTDVNLFYQNYVRASLFLGD